MKSVRWDLQDLLCMNMVTMLSTSDITLCVCEVVCIRN